MELDKDPFDVGLEQAKADAADFASKTYRATLDADTSKADADISATDAALSDYGGKSASASLRVDNTKADLSIDDTDAKLTAYGLRHDTATMSIDDHSATRALSDIDRDATKVDQDFRRLITGSGLAGGALAGLAGFAGVGSAAMQGLMIDSNGASIGLDDTAIAAGDAGEAVGESGGGLLGAVLALAPALIPIGAVGVGAFLGIAGAATAALGGLGAFFLAASAGGGKTGGLSAMSTAMAYVQFQMAAWGQSLSGVIMPALGALAHVAGPLFSALTPLVKAAAGALQLVATYLTQALTSPGFKTFIAFLAAQAGPAITGFVKIFGTFAKGFGTMLMQAAPLIPIVMNGLLNLAKSFASFASSQTFSNFIAYVVQNAPMITTFFGDVLQIAMQLLIAFAPIGVMMVHAFVAVAPLLKLTAQAIGLLLSPLKVFSSSLSTVWSNFANVWSAIGGIWLSWWSTMQSAVVRPIVGFFTVAIPQALNTVESTFSGAWNAVAGIVSTAWHIMYSNGIGILLNFFTGNIPAAVGGLVTMFQQGWSLITSATSTLAGYLLGAWTTISGAALSAWHLIDTNLVQPIVSFFGSTIPNVLVATVSFFTGLPGRIGGALSSLATTITGAFGQPGAWVNSNIIQPVIAFFSGLPGKIVSAIGSGLTVLVSWGSDIVTGIVNGITAAASAIGTAIMSAVKSGISGVASTLNSIPVLGKVFSAIPGLASGGLVTKPTLAMVGEAGPEVVLPLSAITAGFLSGIAPGIANAQSALVGAMLASRATGPAGLGMPSSLAASASNSSAISVTHVVNVTVNGGATAEVAQQIAAEVSAALDEHDEELITLYEARVGANG